MTELVHTAASRALCARMDGRFPHAVLLEGEPGCGKKTLARWLCARMLCTSAGERPCHVCDACARVEALSHPDLRVISGTGGTATLKIEQIRELRENVYSRPFEADKKLYILTDVQTMTEQAQNAFLKILEEPPAYAYFLLTCTDAGALLPTVYSRVQTYAVSSPSVAEAAAYVRKYYPQFAPEQVQTAVTATNGNIGRALSRLQGETGYAPTELEALVTAVLQTGESDLLEITAPLIKDKKRFRCAVEAFSEAVRGAVLLRCGSAQAVEEEAVRQLADTLTQKRLFILQQTCLSALDALERNANMSLLVTAFCAQIRAAAGK